MMVAIADLMEEVGLTVGGFYKHFDSRDDLVVEALRAASGPWQKQLLAAESGGSPLTYESLIDSHLSEAHRDHPGSGCPISALACDIARGSKQIRSLLTERVNFEDRTGVNRTAIAAASCLLYASWNFIYASSILLTHFWVYCILLLGKGWHNKTDCESYEGNY
jgi:AcrR family transcriptional regulator